jgi:hypothetical protein
MYQAAVKSTLHINVEFTTLKSRDHVLNLDTDGGIILRWIVDEEGYVQGLWVSQEP